MGKLNAFSHYPLVPVVGWAAFPANGLGQSKAEGKGSPKWDPFSDRVSIEEMPKDFQRQGTASDSSRSRAAESEKSEMAKEHQGPPQLPESNQSEHSTSGTQGLTDPEFSSFNFWRQPVDDLVED